MNAPVAPPVTAAEPVDASMHDMLRIMDVASALRRERETAESQLDVDTAKARLRERLLATAAAAGETVTPAEVDAAIAQYFARQHRYEDPPPSWRRLRAHLWVNRVQVAAGLVLVGALFVAVLAATGAFGKPVPTPYKPAPVEVRLPSPSPPPSPSATTPSVPEQSDPGPARVPVRAPKPEAFADVWQRFQKSMQAAQQLAADDGARARLQQVAAVAAAAEAREDTAHLRRAQRELDEVTTRLGEQYTITVVDRPGEKSGIDRYFAGRLSGYYLIVEARTADGMALTRSIVNTETKSRDDVTKWGEEIPADVWNRIVADKRADGILDEAVFATKARGSLTEVVVMPDGSGKPMARGRSITRW